ncbi:hypothetical protein D3C84_709260 [compost metagenome]
MRIVPRCDVVAAKIDDLLQQFPEFDFTVAHNVGVRRSTFGILVQEVSENFVVILLLEIYCIKRNVELVTDPSNILCVFFCGTMTEFVSIVPVFHENANNLMPLLFEQQCGNG